MKHLALSALIAATLALPVSAETIRIAMNDAEDIVTNGEFAFVEGFRPVAEAGGFTVEVFPSNALGNEEERLSQTTQGLIHINLGAATAPASMSPLLRMTILPFLFASTEEFDAVMARTELLGNLNSPLLENGVRIAGFNVRGLDAGFFNTKTPVATVEDLQGLRMRALNKGQVAFFGALGVSSTIVDWSEVSNALQTGVVDGYVNPPNSALRTGHTEFLRHYTPAALAPSFRAVMVSEDWYAGLSDEARATIDAALAAGFKANRDWLPGWAAQVDARFAEAGVTVTELAPGERDRLVEMSTPIHAQLLGEEGLERVMGALNQIRGQ
ncbi:TRAP transporter substrate-binding protein [Ruegeria marina]|uniref:TRAP-type C4-dicarboxylate transport system, substrate-binding protein n=1 Tax=Ruegeria marina TaxID=639004 RepID=A0A1G7EV38_9RHOB|nr:TRAP transporter substrate-binding protein [Ruegeria marina]SDE67305.1 TRAP-type C4-dicarboxylate transport system, substrate-binding protein [Ruegeria marina]